jgi:hypothetical protein
MTNLPITLPLASGYTSDQLLARSILLAVFNDLTVRQAMEDSAGQEIFLESKNKNGNPIAAIDFSGLFNLFVKFLPQIGTLLPLILGVFSGGFTAPAIAAIIKILLDLFQNTQNSTQSTVTP